MVKIKAAWSWLLEGLTDAVTACVALAKDRKLVRVILGVKPLPIRDAQDVEIGRISYNESRLHIEPFDIGEQLAGSFIDLEVPSPWILRRDLSPIAKDSLQFLDAFVKHQIDRVSPWKSKDCYYGVATSENQLAQTKLDVRVHIVPRSLLTESLAIARELKGARIRLLLSGGITDQRIVVPVDDDVTERTRIKSIVRNGVIVSLALIVCAVFLLSWDVSVLRRETAATDRAIAQKKAVIAASVGEGSGKLSAADLANIRNARPLAVETLEAMSAALPDNAHLTSFQLTADKLDVTGVSTQTSTLVPSLEDSRRFTDVSFSAATTRIDDGSGDQFYLSMHVSQPEAGGAR